ncbi:MAG: hypothetical protein JXA13_13000 [Anaerolineales bacterium]|nr:hypothetical protein [Anaerolineales bacterium]
MNTLSALKPNSLIVLAAPHAAREEASRLAVELVLHGPLTVLDGGNRFQPYLITRLLRQQHVDIISASRRLSIRRSFTCFQMLALLESTPALQQPYLILDLLAGFYDEQVGDNQAHRLLERCLEQVLRLGQLGPVVITLAPAPSPERSFLVERVCSRADRVLTPEQSRRQASQPALFAR